MDFDAATIRLNRNQQPGKSEPPRNYRRFRHRQSVRRGGTFYRWSMTIGLFVGTNITERAIVKFASHRF
jgi:hypothetical protein